ncbi:transaldolase [Demequina capsici]|uniref:Transaldolase n=1 Tax=Demequina capsici TaxID=3075620 RepID=A0AA96F7D4_9MICO|nr:MULTISPECIES: transaldolase [unclassified Demequina]WNM23276.1 transaldolase [Demequina sp. OYTSA14]WNM26154.1 transaldolase [Demequina sp. PMTSA13]
MSATTTIKAGPLESLRQAGVSVWLDDLSRDRIRSGGLAADIAERGVVGVTTNPSIFAASISGGGAYDSQIADLAARGVGVEEAVRMITTADVRAACDVMAVVHHATAGQDGKVSIEVDPRFARDTEATIAEARQLWWLVDRPNVMIKIPATKEGLPAIRKAISEGINVNVTLIFSLQRYREVVDAYLSGLEDALAAGRDLTVIRSVASFFVSRVDSEVDSRLPDGSPLRGAAAVANAALAYEHHLRVLRSERFKALADHGAHAQRPLWASTSTKDPSFPDTKYVDQLVADGVVNTMPEATLDAVADHGASEAADTVTGTFDEARARLEALAAAGVDLDDVTALLETQGVDKFAQSWEELLAHVREALLG